MHDLPGQKLGQQLLPASALRAIGDLARERLIRDRERPRVRPNSAVQSWFAIFEAAVRVLDVLLDERAALCARFARRRGTPRAGAAACARCPGRRRARVRRPRRLARRACRRPEGSLSQRSADRTSESGSLLDLPKPNIVRRSASPCRANAAVGASRRTTRHSNETSRWAGRGEVEAREPASSGPTLVRRNRYAGLNTTRHGTHPAYPSGVQHKSPLSM
jgi:hypothetical protein